MEQALPSAADRFRPSCSLRLDQSPSPREVEDVMSSPRFTVATTRRNALLKCRSGPTLPVGPNPGRVLLRLSSGSGFVLYRHPRTRLSLRNVRKGSIATSEASQSTEPTGMKKVNERCGRPGPGADVPSVPDVRGTGVRGVGLGPSSEHRSSPMSERSIHAWDAEIKATTIRLVHIAGPVHHPP
jgi:hypothetical protein